MPFLGVTAAAGDVARERMPVGQLLDGTPVTMPVQIVRGRRDGPILYVQAGMHGDEITGIEIARRFIATITPETLHGTVVCVPLANVPSHMTRSRGYEHEERRVIDVNRVFPGDPSGLMSERLAAIMFSEFVAHADLTVDLHSALAGCTIAPFVYVDPDDDANGTLQTREAAAVAFGTPYIYYKPRAAKLGTSDLSRSLSAQADAAGHAVVLAEMGESLRVSKEYVDLGVAGLHNVMRSLGMHDDKTAATPQPRRFSQIALVHVGSGGGLRMHVAVRDEVKAGDRIGEVVDVFGQTVEELLAPTDGFVLRLMLTGAVGTGAEAAWIAS